MCIPNIREPQSPPLTQNLSKSIELFFIKTIFWGFLAKIGFVQNQFCVINVEPRYTFGTNSVKQGSVFWMLKLTKDTKTDIF